ncbi:hypothetical protein B7494_g3077 [Chlorociboria aeruginascens]|nr:hypothetical protein B7494_g3077 [Chlorociboria aeruginascens]
MPSGPVLRPSTMLPISSVNPPQSSRAHRRSPSLGRSPREERAPNDEITHRRMRPEAPLIAIALSHYRTIAISITDCRPGTAAFAPWWCWWWSGGAIR